MPLHILMLSQNIVGQGGTYARCFSLARALARRGHRVTILAASQRPRLRPHPERVDQVTVIQSSGVAPSRVRHAGLDAFDVLGRVLRGSGGPVDVIHAFDHRPAVSIPARIIQQRTGVPLITDWCDLWGRGGLAEMRGTAEREILGRLDTVWERAFHGSADGVTVITDCLADHARTQGVAAEKIALLPSGASADQITPLPQEAMRRKHNLPPDVPLLIHSGFSPFGLDLLASTFTEVCRLDPLTHLLIAGSGYDALASRLTDPQAVARVLDMGRVDPSQLGEVLACGDAAFLPYPPHPVNLVGFPNRLGDFLAAGLPLVTCHVGELGAFVEREGVGLALPPDPQILAEGITVLLGDAPRRTAMGQRARLVAETTFSWNHRAEELEAFYRQVLEKFAAT